MSFFEYVERIMSNVPFIRDLDVAGIASIIKNILAVANDVTSAIATFCLVLIAGAVLIGLFVIFPPSLMAYAFYFTDKETVVGMFLRAASIYYTGVYLWDIGKMIEQKLSRKTTNW